MTIRASFAASLTLALASFAFARGAGGAHVSPAELDASEAPVRWAVIGDYGLDGVDEADVAALVASWRPAFVVTTGDNNYPAGDAATIDANIGKHYHQFIHPYVGAYGPGARTNRFWPSMGNHDWDGLSGQPYFDYFTLPGNERYYDVRLGAIHLFAVDSDPREPDGIAWDSTQAAWLQSALASSTAPWKVVTFHHPSYSSAQHGSTPALQWPFAQWGANVVLNGHDHDYERCELQGFPYFVIGACGAPLYSFTQPVAGSKVRFNADHGAVLVETTRRASRFAFVARNGTVVDTFTLPVDAVAPPSVTLLPKGAVWKYRDNGVFPGAGWSAPGYDDSAWASGPAELGYGDGDEATVVGYGPSSAFKFVTTWFRTTFFVADPASVSTLDLGLLRDDGAVVYLNGVELARSNLPAGAIGPTTLATSAVSGGDEDKFFAFTASATALVAGTNTLAVEIHQSSGSSSDISFDLQLDGELEPPTLVPFGAEWRYLDGRVPPDADWATRAFDDSRWKRGPAQLGYGEGDEATTIDWGADPLDKPPTVWLRRPFTVAGASGIRALRLALVADDGARIWLNGRDAGRWNLPQLGLGASSLAGYDRSGPEENAPLETALDPGLLVDGVNVIAVELHQASVASDDLSFDLRLTAQ